ncbi:MAG: glucose-1-phosphate adenylyltransferase subunit GlgD [Clostridiales bacterium]|nr:glucose-1-phosphate adenylyltransferase subunit GlgD [Clostridiales bacterium]
MRANEVLGIVFSNAYDKVLKELCEIRTMGSVPFCGRYRLIDFTLSNMVNSGVSNVGIITKEHYQSLMDHVGTGRAWDLSRKNGGMVLLPPFNTATAGKNENKVQALNGISSFIQGSKAEYVIMTDCNVVSNFNYNDMLEFHKEKDADITIAYAHGKAPKLPDLLTFNVEGDGKLSKLAIASETDKEVNYSIDTILIKKELLEELIHDVVSQNKELFERDVILANADKLKIYGYKVEGFTGVIDSLLSYYNLNMSLLAPEKCRQLFDQNAPVYTKVRDDMPTIYGLGSQVKNSLIADGCIIDGEVENCILFRGVHIGKGAKVSNSIIMQGTVIEDDVTLDCVITDKNVTVSKGKSLSGVKNYPVCIGKGIVI